MIRARKPVPYTPSMHRDTPDWVRDAVFYQIFPDRFATSLRVVKPGPLEPWTSPPTTHGFKGGDLRGIAEHLPYLQELGITALYLNPIFRSASNHRYHTDDYLSVDPLLGGDDALRELLDSAHARGMRVILDGVFNHTGRGFWPFHHIVENGLASPYVDWFHVDHERLRAGRPLDPYPHSQEPGHGSLARLGYRAWWDLPALPKLRTETPAVREHLLTVAEHWLRFGADGWRLDVPEEIDDETFWQEFRRRCRAVRPDAYLVGEIWHEAHDWLRGDRFDAVMNYPLAQAILGFAAGSHLDLDVVRFHGEYRERVRRLDGPAFAAELRRVMDLYDPAVTAVQLDLLDSHDTPRFVTMAGGDPAALRLGLLLLMSLPGAPCLYYGDEVGLEGGPDPDSRRAFPWDEGTWDRGVLDFTRAVIALRHAEPGLRDTALTVAAASGDVVVLDRRRGPDGLLVAVNAGDEAGAVEVPLEGAGGAAIGDVGLPGWEAPGRDRRVAPSGRFRLELPARSGAVLRIGG
jgi:cyclomaltodextrinase